MNRVKGEGGAPQENRLRKNDSSQMEQLLKQDTWPMKDLKDGRRVCILGGLEKKVTEFIKSPTDLTLKKEILGDIKKELEDLHVNPEVETDEYVKLEIKTIASLHKNMGEICSDPEEMGIYQASEKLLQQLPEKYSSSNSDSQHMVHLYYDGTKDKEDKDFKKIIKNLDDGDKATRLTKKKIIINCPESDQNRLREEFYKKGVYPEFK